MVLHGRNRLSALRSAIFLGVLLLGRFAAAQERSYPTVRLSGFADVILSHSTRSGATDFDFGELDPFVEAQFSERWSALAEGLVQRLERGADTDIPGKRRIEADLQRF